MDTEAAPDTGLMSCPICGTSDISTSFSAHLESHSKQALIDMLLQQQEVLRSIKPSSSRQHNNSGNCPSGRRSPSKKSAALPSKSSNSSKRQTNSGNNQHLPITITIQENITLDEVEQQVHPIEDVETIEQVHGQGGKIILYQLELQNFDDNRDNSSIPYRAIPVKDPLSLDDHENEVAEMHVLPISSSSSTVVSHDEHQSGKLPNFELDMTERFSSIMQTPSTSKSAAKSSKKSKLKRTVLLENLTSERSNSNNTQSQSDVNLMTDEEIPPRGEISEFEESSSNTSSLYSISINDDSSNQRGMGPSLGSLFSNVRRLSPVTVDSNNDIIRTPKKSRKRKPKCQTVVSAIKENPDGIICLDCNETTYFSSIFDLAQHQSEAHPRAYKTFKRKDKETTSASGEIPWAAIQEKKVPIKIQVTDEGEGNPTKPARIYSNRFTCIYCSFTCTQKVLLQHHVEQEHPNVEQNPTMFECRNCGKLCKSRSALVKHLLIHNGKNHCCGYCPKMFTSNFKLKEHERVHTKIYPFKCCTCERTFRTPSLCKAHYKKVHLGEVSLKPKPEFFCKICCRILRSKKSLNNHLECHAQQLIQKCPYCSEIFQKHRVLVRHIRINHDASYAAKESKDCPVCNKRLHPNSMRSHMRIHNNEKPYSCPMCSLTFRTYSNLSSHSWCHTNIDRPFKCPQCPKSYLFKKVLEAHMMTHKRRTMHFVCNECGVKFTSKANMKRHVQEHYTEKKFKCKICDKAFHRNYYLVEHQRIHTGVKLFSCSICGKNSTTKSNHKAHVKIHDARESGSLEG